MTNQTQAALDLALDLDKKERAVLVVRLLQSLDPGDEVIVGWKEEWERELHFREQGVEEGRRELIPAGQALARIFQQPAL